MKAYEQSLFDAFVWTQAVEEQLRSIADALDFNGTLCLPQKERKAIPVATFGRLLRWLKPHLKVELYERLDQLLKDRNEVVHGSSYVMNILVWSVLPELDDAEDEIDRFNDVKRRAGDLYGDLMSFRVEDVVPRRGVRVTKARPSNAPDSLAVVMGRIEAASALAATVVPDMVRHYEMGFVGAAYTVAHECTELVLKMHLEGLGVEYSTFGRDGHDLPKLFGLWGDDREKAEVAYQKWFVGFTVQSRLADAVEKTLRLNDYSSMHERERPSVESINRASREIQNSILRENDPSVAAVLGQIDVMIGPRDVRALCIPARQEQFAEARYPANVWYPEKLLELQWKELVEATGESRSLGIIRWFLEREGTPDVYSAWKYLHEGNLPKVGHEFRGPAIKMIVVAEQLRIFASRGRDK